MAAGTTLPELQTLISTFRANGEIDGDELQDIYQTIYNLLNANDIEAVVTEWDVAEEYDTPTTSMSSGNPAFAISGDRYWKSKTDANIGNAPPSDPGTTENTYWIEISASAGLFKEWAAGIYGAGLVIVFHNDQLWKLTVAERPYESSDIDAEITAGDWTPEGQAITGLLADLDTTDKTNLVAAINELKGVLDGLDYLTDEDIDTLAEINALIGDATLIKAENNFSDISNPDVALGNLLENATDSVTHSVDGDPRTISMDGIRHFTLTMDDNIGDFEIEDLPDNGKFIDFIITIINSGDYSISNWVNFSNPDGVDPDYITNGTTDIYCTKRPDGTIIGQGFPRP